ncbi:hypothetical protein A225_3478 [Klebsiella michiganensis E718]|nr:hypothetical protein A225_3478 [Klebsiella michiganensis E718]
MFFEQMDYSDVMSLLITTPCNTVTLNQFIADLIQPFQ